MTQFCAKVQKLISDLFWALFALNLENESFPRYGICTESQSTIIRFILGHFQQKVMIQFCAKVQKTYFWTFLGHFGPFFPNFGKMRVFPKNRALSLFYIYDPLTSCKKIEKTNEPILRTLHHRRTEDTFLSIFGPFLP